MPDIIKTIRAFAEKLRDDAGGETRIVGTTGAHVALTKAEVAKDLLALLDSLAFGGQDIADLNYLIGWSSAGSGGDQRLERAINLLAWLVDDITPERS